MFARRILSSNSIRKTAELAQTKTPAITTTNALTIRSLHTPIPGSHAEKRRKYLEKFHPAGLPGSKHQHMPLPTAEPEEERGAKVAAQTYIPPSEISDLAPPLLSLEIARAEPVIDAPKAKGGSLRSQVPVVYGNGHWISQPGVDWIRASGQPTKTSNASNASNVPFQSEGFRGKNLTPAQLSVRANLQAHDASISARKGSYDEKSSLSPAARKAAEDGLAEAMEWYERKCGRLAREAAKKQLAEAMEWFDRQVECYERPYVGPWPARRKELAPGHSGVVEVVGGNGRCVCSVGELVGGDGCEEGGCEV